MSEYYNSYVKGASEVASQLSERIRAGSGPKADTSAPEGLMRMRKKIQNEPLTKTDPREMMLKYLSGVKEPVATEEEAAPTSEWTLASATNPVKAAAAGVAWVETRGAKDAYTKLGPTIDDPDSAYYGDRAYGKYQVMGANIGPWTKKVFGKEMSKEEFLKSPAAQDAVVEWKLSQEYKKHGSWDDAASVWFSGQPAAGNKAKDVMTGASVPEYLKLFRQGAMTFADLNAIDLSPVAEAGDQALVKRRTQ